MSLKNRSFLKLLDYTPAEIEELLDLAADLKAKKKAGILKGREGSTVTVETENGPVSFEVNAASGVHLCDDEHLFD